MRRGKRRAGRRLKAESSELKAVKAALNLSSAYRLLPSLSRRVAASLLIVSLALLFAAGCRGSGEKQSVRPRSMRDVPAVRLAYRFEADVQAPPGASAEEQNDKLEPVQRDFNTRRIEERLVSTVLSPDGQRALALYETAAEAEGEFRIDMYAADGSFLRNLTPAELSGAFPEAVSWSPDGSYIAFIGRKSVTPQPTPTPLDDLLGTPAAGASPAPSIAPVFAPIPVFNTEQIYVCNRDGFDLKPLTRREGLIYFYLAWSPDNYALAALACNENEWSVREREFRLPAGRPRLITREGQERLLDDELADAVPVWSPDSSKIAAAFDTDVAVYDAATETPTSARLPLREPLFAASATYDEKNLKKTSRQPVSFNPVVRLDWPRPETLFVKTAYVRTFSDNPVNNFQRWHALHLSPQAALLSREVR